MIAFLEQRSDISALLESSAAPPETPSPCAASAAPGPLTQEQRDEVAEIDAQIAELLMQRREAYRVASAAPPQITAILSLCKVHAHCDERARVRARARVRGLGSDRYRAKRLFLN